MGRAGLPADPDVGGATDAGGSPAVTGVAAAKPAPGGRLSSERERHGWNLIYTAEKLHLEPSVVQALEDNDFAKLGPAVFAKGHLKQYATLLGLPAGELVAAYEERLRQPLAPAAPVSVVSAAPKQARASLPMSQPPSAAADDAQHTPFPDVASPRWYARLPRWALPAAACALLLLVAAGAALLWRPWHRGGPLMVENSQGAAIAPSLEQPPAPVTPIVEPTGSAAPPATSGGAALAGTGLPPGVSAAGRLRLRMSFSADSWVEVRDAAGELVYRGKGAANSVKVIAGAAPLNVFLGSVSGVQLEINNHAVAIGPQFVRGEKARFVAGADGVLRRVPRT
jgi:cytoskeleton protein RodZ